jgi:hypothetical protein
VKTYTDRTVNYVLLSESLRSELFILKRYRYNTLELFELSFLGLFCSAKLLRNKPFNIGFVQFITIFYGIAMPKNLTL